MKNRTLKLGTRGRLTLPMELRRERNLRAGTSFSVIELGDGVFLLSAGPSKIDLLGDQVAQMMSEAGHTLEELLAGLEQERESYFVERYMLKE